MSNVYCLPGRAGGPPGGAGGASSAFCPSGRCRLIRSAGCWVCRHDCTVAQGPGALAIRAGKIGIGSAQRASLTQLTRIRLRDLRNISFVGFQRWANPAFYDELMRACARGGLTAPRIVQEATDRDTQLGLVQCRIGIAWQTESIRWHCPRGVALLPVVDMNIRIPYNLVWKKDNSSPLLQKFIAQVEAVT